MSLLPLGLLSQGGGAGAPADFELIATAAGTGASRVIDFTGIAATYKHLQIRYTAKNDTANANMAITLNNVTTTSYASHAVTADGSSVTSTNASSATSVLLTGGCDDNSTANSFVGAVIDIADYTNTSKNTTLKAFYGRVGGTRRVSLLTGFINSTALINQVTITGSGGNFTTASRFSLYGIKG
jgi:hypothetical protein